jgi:hypothetical protein
VAMVGDVSSRMAGDIDHAKCKPEFGYLRDVAFPQRMGERRDRFGRGPEDRYVILGREFHHPTRVVGVMMGDKDSHQPGAGASQMLTHRSGITGIDDNGIGAPLQTPDVVVAESSERMDVDQHSNRVSSADPPTVNL